MLETPDATRPADAESVSERARHVHDDGPLDGVVRIAHGSSTGGHAFARLAAVVDRAQQTEVPDGFDSGDALRSGIGASYTATPGAHPRDDVLESVRRAQEAYRDAIAAARVSWDAVHERERELDDLAEEEREIIARLDALGERRRLVRARMRRSRVAAEAADAQCAAAARELENLRLRSERG
jgi:hypothetical protein